MNLLCLQFLINWVFSLNTEDIAHCLLDSIFLLWKQLSIVQFFLSRVSRTALYTGSLMTGLRLRSSVT